MDETGRIVVDGRPVPFRAGDSVAIAILRSRETPAGGGTLCLTGDCGNCLAQVDGIAYVRTCQQEAYPGLSVVRHPREGLPPLPTVSGADLNLHEGVHVMTSALGSSAAVEAGLQARSRQVR